MSLASEAAIRAVREARLAETAARDVAEDARRTLIAAEKEHHRRTRDREAAEADLARMTGGAPC